MFRKKTVLIADYVALPDHIRDIVCEWYGFRNDVMLTVPSEFDISGWNRKGLQDYYEDQKQTNSFEGNLDDFIEEYGLQFDVWLIEEIEKGNVDLTGVDQVIINVSW